MIADFEDWLRKGLGRAVVHLKSHDSEPYRAAIVHACTHNLAYDPQCEDTRAQYCIDLIQTSSDVQFYRDGLLQTIVNAQPIADDSEFDLGQIYAVAAHFANDAAIRTAMYATFHRLGFAEAGLACAEQLIKLDGLDALLIACETFSQVDADDRPWMFGQMLAALNQKQPLPETLKQFALEWQADQARPRTTGPTRLTYPEVKARIIQQGRKAGMLFWTKHATIEELHCLANDLLAESDPDRLYGYLRMFHRQEFPQDPARLLELAGSTDVDIARVARHALANSSHPCVRPLALELAPDPENWGLVLKLLSKNRDPSDYPLMERFLAEPADNDHADWLMGQVLDYIAIEPRLEAIPALIQIYEKSPCGICRKKAVEQLLALNALPNWLRNECLYDANMHIRNITQTPSPQN